MELDFSALDALAGQTPAPEPPARQERAEGRALNLLEEERQDRERQKQVYTDHQNAIRQTETEIEEIMRGLNEGANMAQLLLKAVHIVGLLTGNRAICPQAADRIKTVYGRGLGEPDALKLELQETQNRLNRLEEATRDRALTTEELDRIRTAIREHGKKINRLQEQLKQAGKPERKTAFEI